VCRDTSIDSDAYRSGTKGTKRIKKEECTGGLADGSLELTENMHKDALLRWLRRTLSPLRAPALIWKPLKKAHNPLVTASFRVPLFPRRSKHSTVYTMRILEFIQQPRPIM
jgi:hypothetical protein